MKPLLLCDDTVFARSLAPAAQASVLMTTTTQAEGCFTSQQYVKTMQQLHCDTTCVELRVALATHTVGSARVCHCATNVAAERV
jgi:hypothetical protein